MPNYKITDPETGKSYIVRNAPDQETAVAEIQRTKSAAPASAAPAEPSMPQSGGLGGIADTISDINTGVGQGLTLGFNDEIAAGLAAPLRMAKNAITGDDEGKSLLDRFTGAYNRGLEKQRGIVHTAQKRSPVGSAVGEGVGAVMSTAGSAPLGVGRTLLGRAGIGAAEAGAYGAGYGFGSGEGLEDRKQGALIGGGVGALTGGALPVVGAGVSRAWNSNAIQQGIVNPIVGAFNVDSAAGRMLRNAGRRDAADGSARMSPQMFADAQARNQPVRNIDRFGNAGHSLARTASDLSPEARTALTDQVLDPRYSTHGDRISSWLHQRVPGSNTPATLRQLEEASQQELNPLYRDLYAQGDFPVESDELNRLVGASPLLQDAVRNVVKGSGAERAAASGLGAFKPGARVTEDGRVLIGVRNHAPSYPNLQFWDYVKREADSIANVGKREGRDTAAQYQNIAALRTELDRIVPAYRDVRGRAASYFDAEDATTAGRNFAERSTQEYDPRELANAVSSFTNSERELFKRGFVSHWQNMIGNHVVDPKSTSDLVPRLLGTRNLQEKWRTVLGDRDARDFEAMMRIEQLMHLPRAVVKGNSKTAQYLAAAGLSATVTGGMTGDLWNPYLLVGALAGGGARALGRGVDRRVAQRVAQMLASNDQTLYQQGMALVTNSPPMMQALRRFSSGLNQTLSAGPAGAVIGQQAAD